VKKGRGPATGKVIQCLKSGQLEGLGIEHVLLYRRQTLQAHRHRRSEALLIVTRGSGKMLLNGKTIRVKKGHVISIPPGTAHGFITEGQRLEFVAIQRPGIYQPGKEEDIEIVPQGRLS
jgi:quercetin dioxygenase-like cupin family protein